MTEEEIRESERSNAVICLAMKYNHDTTAWLWSSEERAAHLEPVGSRDFNRFGRHVTPSVDMSVLAREPEADFPQIDSCRDPETGCDHRSPGQKAAKARSTIGQEDYRN